MFIDDVKQRLKVVGEIGFSLCMIARDRLVVSGVKRIVFCDEDCLKLKLKNETIAICGKKLSIEQIGGGDVFVTGFVNEVKFED